MPRLILVCMTAATVMLVIAAAFFCDGGDIGAIDRAGMEHYGRGEFARALSVWEAGLKRYPESSELHYRVGTTLAVHGDFTEGAAHLERALQLSPDDHKIRKELALCYLRDKRLDDAERELKTLLSRADWFPEAHYFLGRVLEQRGDREAAMEEYVRELNVNANCTYAWAKVFESRERSQPRVGMTAAGFPGDEGDRSPTP